MENYIKNPLDEIYLKNMKTILENGDDSLDRTGVGTKSMFQMQFRHNLQDGFPLLTCRQHYFKIAFYETLMFLNGDSDSKKWLENNGVNIWKGNTSREFLDNRGLHHLPEGNIGKAYGYQWRNFNGEGVDQLANIFNTLKTNPYDRRMLITAWNPADLDEMPLPSCHTFYQFYVRNNKLSCSFYMRSCDILYGLSYNLACYGLITFLLAKALGFEVGELIANTGDTHIYNNQIESIKELFDKKVTYELPKLNIKKDLKTLEDICNITYDEIELVNYQHAGKITKVDMAI